MPYTIYDSGVRYYLMDHLSIQKMMEEDRMREIGPASLINTMRKKFPQNQELMAYLNGVEERRKIGYKAGIPILEGIEKDLKNSGGELYEYKILGKKSDMGDGTVGVDVENGFLILSKGKVFKKYTSVDEDNPPGRESESYLKDQGLKVDR